MTSATAAPSGSIQGSACMRNTFFRPSVQKPACAQIARLSKMVIALPAYATLRLRPGSALLRSEKTVLPVSAIAKRLAGRTAAAAQRDLPSGFERRAVLASQADSFG